MTVFEVLMRTGELEVTCLQCRTRTRLEASFFARRYGEQTTLDVIAKVLVCAACGSGSVVVGCATDEVA
jgi:hypothetical protein